MKTRNAITKLAVTMAVAALVAAGLLYAAGWLQPVAAQTGNDSVSIISYASLGIVPGEKVRFCVENTAAVPGSAITWTYKVTNTGDVPLYESEGIRVPAGEFRCSDVSRADLRTEGEPGTGRAEFMVKATIQAPAGSRPEVSPVSAEVIKELTGATSEVITFHEYGHAVSLRHDFVREAAIIGFTPGERLTFTVINPAAAGGGTVRVTSYLYDDAGRTVSRSSDVDLRPDQSYTFAVNYEDLPLAGEDGTGRKEVRGVIQVSFGDASVHSFKLPVRVALVSSTGSTTYGGDYYCGSITVSGDGFGER